MCIGFMLPGATLFKEFYSDHHQIQVLDTPGYQGTEFKASWAFAVEHRREVVVLKCANVGEGGISKPYCLDDLVPVQRVQRADERTRSADPISLRVSCSTAERGPQTFLYALVRSICWVPSSVSRARNLGSECV